MAGPKLYIISTAPGFDQSPSENEQFAQEQLHFPSKYLRNFHYFPPN